MQWGVSGTCCFVGARPVSAPWGGRRASFFSAFSALECTRSGLECTRSGLKRLEVTFSRFGTLGLWDSGTSLYTLLGNFQYRLYTLHSTPLTSNHWSTSPLVLQSSKVKRCFGHTVEVRACRRGTEKEERTCVFLL